MPCGALRQPAPPRADSASVETVNPGTPEAMLALLRARLHRDTVRRELQTVAKRLHRIRLRDVLVEVLVAQLGECRRRRRDNLAPLPLPLDVLEPRARRRARRETGLAAADPVLVAVLDAEP